METPKLILPPQVRPQREVIPQAKADTETPKSIFDNPNFLAELQKGPEQALKAINALSPEQKAEFASQVSDLSGVQVSPRDLGSILAKDFNPAFVASFEAAKANPQAVFANPKAFVQEQVARITQTQAPKAVVERPQVQGKLTSLNSNSNNGRVLAEVLAQAA